MDPSEYAEGMSWSMGEGEEFVNANQEEDRLLLEEARAIRDVRKKAIRAELERDKLRDEISLIRKNKVPVEEVERRDREIALLKEQLFIALEPKPTLAQAE